MWARSSPVTYEVLTAGLPVLCTTNTGSMVFGGHDVFIARIRDVDAMVKKMDLLAQNSMLLLAMQDAARTTAVQYDIGSYGRRLSAALLTSVR